MSKTFNTTAICIPEMHYMVNIESRLKEISRLVDTGKYFAINRARQYGKTTTLMALNRYLQETYHMVSMDFQTFGSADFSNEAIFSSAFADSFLDSFMLGKPAMNEALQNAIEGISQDIDTEKFTLRPLFQWLATICAASSRPIVLIIDEVDSAANNQVFLDFLAQLRAQYIRRFQQPAFWSVILATEYFCWREKHHGSRCINLVKTACMNQLLVRRLVHAGSKILSPISSTNQTFSSPCHSSR